MNKAERLEILNKMKKHFEQNDVKLSVTPSGVDYYNPENGTCCPIGAVCPEPRKMQFAGSYLTELASLKEDYLNLRIGSPNTSFVKELWADDGENGNFYDDVNNTTTGLWQHIQLVHDHYAMKAYHQTMTKHEALGFIVRALDSAIYHVEKGKQ